MQNAVEPPSTHSSVRLLKIFRDQRPGDAPERHGHAGAYRERQAQDEVARFLPHAALFLFLLFLFRDGVFVAGVAVAGVDLCVQGLYDRGRGKRGVVVLEDIGRRLEAAADQHTCGRDRGGGRRRAFVFHFVKAEFFHCRQPLLLMI